MVRFFFGAAPDLAGAPRMLRSSLLRASIRSLIAAARLSWLIVRSDKFMGLVNIQYWWKSSTGQVPRAGDDAYHRPLSKSSPMIASRRHMIQVASKFQAKRSSHWRQLAPGDYKVKHCPPILTPFLTDSKHLSIPRSNKIVPTLRQNLLQFSIPSAAVYKEGMLV